MPRPKRPESGRRSKYEYPPGHSLAWQEGYVDVSGHADPAKVFVDVRIDYRGWARILRALRGDRRPPKERGFMDPNTGASVVSEINHCLYWYAIALDEQTHGPTPRAVADELRQIRNAGVRLLGLVDRADPLTQSRYLSLMRGALEPLRYVIDGNQGEGGLPGLIRHLDSKQRKPGKLPNVALRELASRLVYVFLRWKPTKNRDWRTFVSAVLTAARVEHPNPADPKNGARFDALVSDKVREALAVGLGAKCTGARRPSASSPKPLLGSSGDLGSAILAASAKRRALEPRRGRRRLPRKKGT